MNLQSNDLVSPIEPPRPTFDYDGFISYQTATDYSLARKLEAFLEEFHKVTSKAAVPVRQLQICRDGSDFRLPKGHESANVSDEHGDDLTDQERKVWNIIKAELELSRYLIV